MTRIVIPTALKVIQLAHEGHQGIVKTKALLRSKVWFPNIDCSCMNLSCVKPIHQLHSLNHSKCQIYQKLTCTVLVQTSIDHSQLESTCLSSLMITHATQLSISSTANTVIPVLENVFFTFGIPRILKTDNGPPFNSDQFAGYLGFHHTTVAPSKQHS